MRAVFGLVGILVALGVIVVIMSTYTLPAAKQGIAAKKKVEEQFEMNTPQGYADAQASITLDDAMRGSRFDGLQVTAIVPGGSMSNAFGFLPGDKITAIGPVALRDSDPDTARALLFEAKLRQYPVKFVRNGQEMQVVGQ